MDHFGILVGQADGVPVVGFGEEARGAQHQAGQAVIAVEQLAQLFSYTIPLGVIPCVM